MIVVVVLLQIPIDFLIIILFNLTSPGSSPSKKNITTSYTPSAMFKSNKHKHKIITYIMFVIHNNNY